MFRTVIKKILNEYYKRTDFTGKREGRVDKQKGSGRGGTPEGVVKTHEWLERRTTDKVLQGYPTTDIVY